MTNSHLTFWLNVILYKRKYFFLVVYRTKYLYLALRQALHFQSNVKGYCALLCSRVGVSAAEGWKAAEKLFSLRLLELLVSGEHLCIRGGQTSDLAGLWVTTTSDFYVLMPCSAPLCWPTLSCYVLFHFLWDIHDFKRRSLYNHPWEWSEWKEIHQNLLCIQSLWTSPQCCALMRCNAF